MNVFYISFHKTLKSFLNIGTIHFLSNSDKGKIKRNEYKYFLFHAENRKGSIFYAKVTQGQEKCAIFISTKNPYPNEKDFLYKNEIKFYSNPGENESTKYYTNYEPFALGRKNELIYLQNLNFSCDNNIIEDSIALKVDSDSFVIGKGNIYISILNLTSEDIHYSIFVKGI